MKKTSYICSLLLAGFIVCASIGVNAEDSTRPAPPTGGRPPGPPPEALQACSGKTLGTACSFSGREGRNMSGKCFGPPPARPSDSNAAANNAATSNSSTVLACRPDRGDMPPPGDGKPPAESGQ